MQDWEQEETIVIARGEGSWLIDTDGNRYLDGVASMWTNVHGHCRRELNEAIKAQVRASLAAVRASDVEAITRRAMAGVDPALVERSSAAASTSA